MAQEHQNHTSDALRRAKEDIAKYGYSVCLFESTPYLPAFAYTIGLMETYNHPELIMFGLPVDTLHGGIAEAVYRIKKGHGLNSDQVLEDVFEEVDVKVVDVHESSISNYFGYGMQYYNRPDIEALQLVWPDGEGLFPWQENYSKKLKWHQPLLDRNYNFKFREPENLGIYTSRFVTELKQPVTYVVHEEDGDWQFLTDDEVVDSDIRLICLKEMVEMDKTINEVFDLEYGEFAQRKGINDRWHKDSL